MVADNSSVKTGPMQAGGGHSGELRLDERLAAVQSALFSGDAGQALAILAPVLEQRAPPIQALIAAGNAWWHLAMESGGAAHYANTADMFTRVLERCPERQELQHRIGYCRLLQAQAEPTDQQIELLDEAVMRLGIAAGLEDHHEARLLTDWGYALLQRASLMAGGQMGDFACAESAFRAALMAGAEPDSDTAWLLQRALRMQASVQPENAAEIRSEVQTIIDRALREGRNDPQRPMWQASAIQSELDAVLTEGLTGAVKRMRLREIQNRYHALIVPDTPAPIVMSWIKVLCAEAEDLIGGARKAKYAEAAQVLRLSAKPEQEQNEIELRLMTSRIARWRGALEPPEERMTFLTAAEAVLQPYWDHPVAHDLKMEAVHVIHEQATLLGLPKGADTYRRVMAMSKALTNIPALEVNALRCYLTASIAVAEPDGQRISMLGRLVERDPNHEQTWTISAQIAFLSGEMEKANRCCEMAWRMGAPRTVLLPLWRKALARWAKAAGDDYPAALVSAARKYKMAEQAPTAPPPH